MLRIDKDGKMDYFSRKTFDVMNDEFGFDAEKMADEIISLREQLQELDEKIGD